MTMAMITTVNEDDDDDDCVVDIFVDDNDDDNNEHGDDTDVLLVFEHLRSSNTQHSVEFYKLLRQFPIKICILTSELIKSGY